MRCAQCHKPLPVESRADRKFCAGPCRAAWHRSEHARAVAELLDELARLRTQRRSDRDERS